MPMIPVSLILKMRLKLIPFEERKGESKFSPHGQCFLGMSMQNLGKSETEIVLAKPWPASWAIYLRASRVQWG